MKEKDKKKIKLGLYSMIGLLAIVAVVSAISMFSTGIAPVNEVMEEINIPPALQPENPTSTAITWEGKLDLFVIPADTGIREQVVYGEHNLITNIGAAHLRGYLNGSVAADVAIGNLSLSNDAGAADAAWTELPAEIAANGLDRATGTFLNNDTSGAYGAFNITYTWTATDSQSCQLIGTHWSKTDSSDNNLFSALKFTQQSLLVNDQLEAVYSVTIS